MKSLVEEAAVDAGLDIFDNVFDWAIKVANIKISSDPKKLLQSKLKGGSGPVKPVEKGSKEYERAQRFRFRSYKDVKILIYMAYSKKLDVKASKNESGQSDRDKKD